MDVLQEAIDREQRRKRLPRPAERKLLRLQAGLTQRDVALSLGISTAAVSRYESGDREPRAAILSRYLTVMERLIHANSAA